MGQVLRRFSVLKLVIIRQI